jgi:hypothetical protein
MASLEIAQPLARWPMGLVDSLVQSAAYVVPYSNSIDRNG